ncbi:MULTISPECIES: PepSY-associated TM helix domain-containing protein [Leclercia]|uniref:PepSY domain-containing protein n=1 Tax=Leclercia barmai TaxID=2785629 RepID=A0ABS7RWZ7_9ENTR|nr:MULTISPECIES: PepSY-associated TM helix domain-containing protein [Leclercia]MBZ0058772.1 PepSY domain-containing protein [Leclercia sp. EMC7]MCM5696178.1 PepSY domain-containing protein [Leclercia sp. LTM01]MCM5702423.1 PepSY domain-containing protein [Leclercia sp. LTM14]
MTTCTSRAAWGNLLRRLHFYIGLFVGPFIFIAALSGTLYVATPQLENALYHHALFSEARGTARPLAEQIAVAEKVTGGELRLHAVRPGLADGDTTRVMYADPALKASENRAIFIDPVSLEVRGDMTVYGTSGILPFRQTIDYLHQSLMLGDVGRLYSELAASWMWIAALGGIALWFYTRPKRRINNRFQNRRRLHVTLGWCLLLGMLLFSATGLTWSQWAGGNVDKLRAEMNWLTPQVKTQLHGPAEIADPHADHHGHHMSMPMPEMKPDPALYDGVLQAANAAGIKATKLEIRPAKSDATAWTVTEIDRRWPTQVDAVAVDPATLAVIDHTRFADYPLMAKLTRWGVDFHMGVLFGLPNQLVLIAFGVALCVMIVWGYRMWWMRRPRQTATDPAQTLCQSWLALPLWGRCVSVGIAVLLGLAMPVMGCSLALFIVIDWLRWRAASGLALAGTPE